jgi:MFS family permease
VGRSPSRQGLLALLRRNPAFRRLFVARAISLVGDWFSYVALSGLVYDLTGRPGAPPLIFAAQSLPMFLLVPVTGAAADRFDRKRLKVAGDLAAVLPVLGFLAAARWEGVGLALGGAAVLSTLAAFADPVPEAALPNLVAPGSCRWPRPPWGACTRLACCWAPGWAAWSPPPWDGT